MATADLSNPILNTPFDAPDQHFALGSDGPTGEILKGRRPSESFIPIPTSRKGKGADTAAQDVLDFDITGERREKNELINDIRRQVELWRARGYRGVTPISRKLLQHWAAGEGVREVARFVEKPPHDRAEAMLAEGGHYWNAGIFLASVQTWREELEAYVPAIFAASSEAIERAVVDGPVRRIDAEAFARSPAQSIDYAVMEHSTRVSVVPVAMGWSDIGSWTALFDASAKDEAGNVLGTGTVAIDANANLIRTSGPRIAALGVDDLVIVATPEAVLVTRLSQAQRVREAADWFDRQAKS